MPKESPRIVLESYAAVVWRAVIKAAKGIAAFIIRIVELVLQFSFEIIRSLAALIRAIAWFVLAVLGVGLSVVVVLYLVAEATDLAASPAFQEMRETILNHMLTELKEDIATDGHAIIIEQ